jgi:IS30 family transposase
LIDFLSCDAACCRTSIRFSKSTGGCRLQPPADRCEVQVLKTSAKAALATQSFESDEKRSNSCRSWGLQPVATKSLTRPQSPEQCKRAGNPVPGHYEGNLLCGGVDSQIATPVEHKSGFTKLVKVDTKSPTDVAFALSRKVAAMPPELRKTMTWDRGFEMAKQREFTKASQMPVYFCDPQSSGSEVPMRRRVSIYPRRKTSQRSAKSR